MRKFLFSTILIGTFALYAIFSRQKTLGAMVMIDTPKNTQPSTQPIMPSMVVPPTSMPKPQEIRHSDGTVTIIYPTPRPTSTPTPSPAPVPVPNSMPMMMPPRGAYKDGQFMGSVADAYYGNVRVKAMIQNGSITDVQFLEYPNDTNHSRMLNTAAIPKLVTEAIQMQSTKVNIVTGATETSNAFRESLGTALNQAQ